DHVRGGAGELFEAGVGAVLGGGGLQVEQRVCFQWRGGGQVAVPGRGKGLGGRGAGGSHSVPDRRFGVAKTGPVGPAVRGDGEGGDVLLVGVEEFAARLVGQPHLNPGG